MLTELDHIVLVCGDIDAATYNYSKLIGRSPDWTSKNEEDGTSISLFKIGGTALELLAPSGKGVVGDKLRQMVSRDGEGLTSLAFACKDIEKTRKKFVRRGINPSEIGVGASLDDKTGKRRSWRRMRLDTDLTFGVRQFVLELDEGSEITSQASHDDCVSQLDHVVINSPAPERAASLYGAKLGGELRLDLVREDLASRFQFYRIGRASIEIVSRLGEEDKTADDALWGVSWRVKNIEGAHQRLKDNGFQLTDIRPGRKKDSKVFTVLDRTCNTPTLFIERT